jgi:hypothetical protein
MAIISNLKQIQCTRELGSKIVWNDRQQEAIEFHDEHNVTTHKKYVKGNNHIANGSAPSILTSRHFLKHCLDTLQFTKIYLKINM